MIFYILILQNQEREYINIYFWKKTFLCQPVFETNRSANKTGFLSLWRAFLHRRFRRVDISKAETFLYTAQKVHFTTIEQRFTVKTNSLLWPIWPLQRFKNASSSRLTILKNAKNSAKVEMELIFDIIHRQFLFTGILILHPLIFKNAALNFKVDVCKKRCFFEICTKAAQGRIPDGLQKSKLFRVYLNVVALWGRLFL